MPKSTKVHQKKMEDLAGEIRKFLLDREMWQDTRIYFNGKAYCSCPMYIDGKNVNYNNPKHLHVIEDIDPANFMDYYRRDTVTMSFEGELYDALNDGDIYDGWETQEAFHKLLAHHGYYYELGNSWNLSLHEND